MKESEVKERFKKLIKDYEFKGKLYLKQIKLVPTTRSLYVIIGDDRWAISNLMHALFDGPYSPAYYDTDDQLKHPHVNGVSHEELYDPIYMVLHGFKLDTIAHECMHVLNRLNIKHGLEIGPGADEWNSYYLGWLFGEITSMEKENVFFDNTKRARKKK